MKLKYIIKLARPKHWVKNIIIFFPVVFGFQMGNLQALVDASLAFLAFCLVSSASYVFNDIRDRERDRLHPDKRGRPLAANQISVTTAVIESIVLLCAGLVLSRQLGLMFLSVASMYVILQLAYSLRLKNMTLIDVICIAMGFVLRAAAGAVAIRVEISPWLFICTFTICLFMGFCKRYSELLLLGGKEDAEAHRPTLIRYTPELLNHLITLSAALAVISFLLYATSARTVEHLGTGYLVYSVPLVIYAIFRFAMLSMEGSYANPTDLILRDRPFQLTAVVWVLFAIAVIFLVPQVQVWIDSKF